jgi:hypothetical protein
MSDCTDRSMLPIGANAPETDELSPLMQRYAFHLYREAWEDYRAAGCPYGENDDAMLVWYSLHGAGPSPATSKN